MNNNPYVGPRPFERADRDKFFGRMREARDLLSLIMAERVVLFYAQSGAGKTSLLSTQIIPSLEGEGFKVLPIARVGGDMPRGVDPAAAKNIFVFSALLSLAGAAAQPQNLLPQTLSDFLQQPTDDEYSPIVIFDQFEELLTTHRERWQEVRGFMEQLRDVLAALPKLGVVLAMREDYVAGLDPYAVLLPRRLKTRFRMELLGYDGALEAVKKPAQNAGFGFGTGVAERLVDDLRRIQRAADNSLPDTVHGPYVEPVQLQVVCSRLWDNLPERSERIITWSDVEQFGNVDQALTGFYESSLQHTVQVANVSERQLRRWFGSELVTLMKTRGLALRGEQDTSGLPNAAVDDLEQQHLIRAEVRAGAHWYELAHDRLVDPIIASNAAWEQARLTSLHITAKKWQESKNADLLIGGSYLVDAIRFTKTHPDEVDDYLQEFMDASIQAERTKARNRIVRLSVIAALGVGMIIMAALAVLALQSKQEAEVQRAVAYEAKATAEAGKQVAEQQRQIAVTAQAQAETSRVEAERQSRLAQVRQLATQAQQALEKSPQRSVLLALEAVKLSQQDPESSGQVAEQALRDVLSAVGGHGVTTLNDDARAVAFSPDGRWLAIGGENVQIFDRKNLSSTSISLTGNTDAITALVFNSAGHLAAGSLDGTVRVWNSTDWSAEPFVLETHASKVGTVAFSPDGRRLAAGHDSGQIRLWDMQNLSASPQTLFTGEGEFAYPVRSLAFNPKAPLLAGGSDNGAVRIWDLNNPDAPPQSVKSGVQGHDLFSVAFSADGRQLAAALDQNVLVWNAADDFVRPITLTVPGESFTAAAFLPHEPALLAGDLDGRIYIWDRVEPGPEAKPPRTLVGHEDAIYNLALSPDGQWLASAGRDKAVRLWNLTRASDTETPYALFPGLGSLSDDGRWLSVFDENQSTVRIFDLTSADLVSNPTVLRNAPPGASDIKMSSDHHWLAALGRDDAVTLWDVTQPAAPLVLHAPPGGSFGQFEFAHDGRWLIAKSWGQGLTLWDLSAPARTPITLGRDLQPIFSWTASPDGHWLATYGTDGTDEHFQLWDLTATDSQATPLTLENASKFYSLDTEQLINLRFSSDGRWLLAAMKERGTDTEAFWLWDLRQPSPETAKPLAFNLAAPIDGYAFSPHGRWMATVMNDGSAFVWDLQANVLMSIPLTMSKGQALSAAFSPDGRWLAVGGNDKVTYLWETTHLIETPRTLLGQDSAVNQLIFSPDSKWLATSGVPGGSSGLYMLPEHYEDPAVLLWNLEQSTLAPLNIHSPAKSLTAEGFSPDGRWLVTSNDNGAQVWQVKVDELVPKACEAAGRNLTRAEWQQYLPNQEYRKTCAQWP